MHVIQLGTWLNGAAGTPGCAPCLLWSHTLNSSRLACSEMAHRRVPLFYMLGVRPSRHPIPLLPILCTEHPGILCQWD